MKLNTWCWLQRVTYAYCAYTVGHFSRDCPPLCSVCSVIGNDAIW